MSLVPHRSAAPLPQHNILMKISHHAVLPCRCRPGNGGSNTLARLSAAVKNPNVGDIVKFLLHPVALASLLFLIGALLA